MVQELYSVVVLEKQRLAKLLSDKWMSRVVLALRTPMRFTQLQRHLSCSSKTLTNKLKRLEEEGIATRVLIAQVPLRVEYTLSKKGHELAALITSFAEWEQKWS